MTGHALVGSLLYVLAAFLPWAGVLVVAQGVIRKVGS